MASDPEIVSRQARQGHVTFHAGGQDKLATWVLSWGLRAEVLRPPTLAHAVEKETGLGLKHLYHTR